MVRFAVNFTVCLRSFFFSKLHFQCTYNLTLKRVRVTIAAVEKQEILNITNVCMYSALVIQHAKRLRCYIVICGLPGCTVFFHIF